MKPYQRKSEYNIINLMIIKAGTSNNVDIYKYL